MSFLSLQDSAQEVAGLLGKPEDFFLREEYKAAFTRKYKKTVQYCLEEFYWTFAERFVPLKRAVSPPAGMFTFAFDLPTDYLHRTFLVDGASILGPDIPFTIEGNFVFTENAVDPHLSYTRMLKEGEKVKEQFNALMEAKIAYDFSLLASLSEEDRQFKLIAYRSVKKTCVQSDYRNQHVGKSISNNEYTSAHRAGVYNAYSTSDEAFNNVIIPEEPL